MKKRLLSIVLLLETLFNISCDFSVPPLYVYSPDMDLCVIVSDSTMKVRYKDNVVQMVSIDIAKWSKWNISYLQKCSYSMVSGKRYDCTDYYNELVYKGVDGRRLVVRVFCDGVAFCPTSRRGATCSG